jgi:microcin C transport system substrate-binding protein
MTASASKLLLPAACAAALLTAGCPGGGSPPEAPPAAASAASAAPAASEWKPSEGCPPVPVPDGDFDLLGDPRACKGGRFVVDTNSYPTHLSYYGPERDFAHLAVYGEGFLNTLVQINPNTLQPMPELATWEEPVQGKVFVFHIDPDAKWSDGKPIVADDVLMTWAVAMEPSVGDIQFQSDFALFERPVKVDERTVRWEAKQASWRNIQILSNVFILPAHATNPKTYAKEWLWTPPVYSGMYEVGAYEEGKFFEMVRRKDFWGEGKRQFIGVGNFDSVYWKVIENDDLVYEFFKKGEIDYYLVIKSQRWAEETEIDKVQKGWIQKQRMYMREPEVPARMAFNLEHPIFKDPKVRRGLFWLYDREHLHEELFFNEYRNKNSFFENSIYANPDNEKITFNPEKGLALLEEAGWTQRDTDGILMKDGKRLEFEFIYLHPNEDRILTPVQETFRKYGVSMKLKLVQPPAWSKVMDAKEFEMVYANWGRTPFPDPRQLWHSSLAHVPATANVTRFDDPRADALIEEYEREFDLQKRADLLRRLDALLYEQTPYLLDWYTNNWRNMWWDKFGMPTWVSWASIDIRYTHWQTWWHEPAREARLKGAMEAGRSLPRGPAEATAWKLP